MSRVKFAMIGLAGWLFIIGKVFWAFSQGDISDPFFATGEQARMTVIALACIGFGGLILHYIAFGRSKK